LKRGLARGASIGPWSSTRFNDLGPITSPFRSPEYRESNDSIGRAAAGAQVTVYVSLVISKPTLPMKISSGRNGSVAVLQRIRKRSFVGAEL